MNFEEYKEIHPFLWKDDENIKLRKEYLGHELCVSCAIEFGELNRLVTCSFDCRVIIFNYETGEKLKTLQDNQGSGDMINHLIKWETSEEEVSFLTCNDQGKITEWSVNTMTEIRKVLEHDSLSPHKMVRIGKETLVFLDGYNGCLVMLDTLKGTTTFTLFEQNMDPDFTPFFRSNRFQNALYCGWNSSHEIAMIEYDLHKMSVCKKFQITGHVEAETRISACNVLEKDNIREILVVFTYSENRYRGKIFFFDTSSSGEEIHQFKSVSITSSIFPYRTNFVSTYRFSNDIFLVGSKNGFLCVFDFSSCFKLAKEEEEHDGSTLITFSKRISGECVRGVFVSDKNVISRRNRDGSNSVRFFAYSEDGKAKDFSFLNCNVLRDNTIVDEDLQERTKYLVEDLMESEELRQFYDVFQFQVNGISLFFCPRILLVQ